jgi:hypothetical protein
VSACPDADVAAVGVVDVAVAVWVVIVWLSWLKIILWLIIPIG